MSRQSATVAALIVSACSACSDGQPGVLSRADVLPLRPASGQGHAEWLGQWKAKLRPAIILYRGEHQGEVQGSYYSRVKITYPVFLATLAIENNTGHRLVAGRNQYLVQTALTVPESAGNKGTALEVIGGRFLEPPSEDYAGVVEVRGDKVTPDIEFGLVDAVDTIARRGFFGSGVDLFLAVGGGGNQLERRVESDSSFGSADDGKTLRLVSNDLQLTVRVASDREGTVHFVGPIMTFRDAKGSEMSFRYVFRFEKGAEQPSDTTLLALDDESLLPMIKASDEPLWRRVFAAGWAGQLSSSAATAALVDAAGAAAAQPGPIRESALRALAGKPEGNNVLKSVAIDDKEKWPVRRAAVGALGASKDTAASLLLKGLLRDRENRVRGAAIDALAEQRAKHATSDLVALLSESDASDVRSNLARAIGQLGSPGTADSLAALGTKDADLRRTLIPIVAKLSPTSALPVFESWYALTLPQGTKDENWTVRLDVCEQLEGMDDARANALLDKCLADSHDWVRSAAVRSLAKPPTASRVQRLVGFLGDTSKPVLRAAVRALGATKSPNAKTQLLEIVGDVGRSKEMRWAAVEALADYRDSDVSQVLIASLKRETDANVRADTYSSLARQTTAASRSAVEQGLRDTSSYVTARSARIWRNLRGHDACAATLNAMLGRKDGDGAEALVNMLALPGCRDRIAFDKIVARFGAGDAEYDAELARLLKAWTGGDAGTDKAKWATMWK